MPDRLPSLQGYGIPRTPIPSISDLQMGQSVIEIDRDEVVSLLRDPGAEPGRLLSAIALVEWLTRLAPGLAVELESSLRARLADPGEDPVLRTEAHSLLAPRMALPVHHLQERGLPPHPILPRAETLFHNVPLFDRDTEGEWTLPPDAIKLGHLVFSEDLLAVLREPDANPSRACSAAPLLRWPRWSREGCPRTSSSSPGLCGLQWAATRSSALGGPGESAPFASPNFAP